VVILGFIGVKLVSEAMWATHLRHLGSWQVPRVSTQVSLLVIVGVLMVVAVASIVADRVSVRRSRLAGGTESDSAPSGNQDVTV
jgi:tellurite resistance protein TerC